MGSKPSTSGKLGACIWATPPELGSKPAPRCGHTLTILSGTAVVYGGCGSEVQGATVFGDVHTLDLVTWKWSLKTPGLAASPILGLASPGRTTVSSPAPAKVNATGAGGHESPQARSNTFDESQYPSARWRHSAVAVDSTKILIFGGSGPSRNAPRLNDLWVLELKKDIENLGDRSLQSPVPPNLIPPNLILPEASRDFADLAASHGHPESLLEDSEDVTALWSIVPASGKVPAPRSDHSAVFDGKSMWIFGGYGGDGQSRAYLMDLCCLAPKVGTSEGGDDSNTKLEWTYPQTSGTAPRARSAHSASMMERCMIVAGGRDQNGIRSDAFVLNLDTMTWALLKDFRSNPNPGLSIGPSRAESRAGGSTGAHTIPPSPLPNLDPPVPLFPPTPASAPSAPTPALLNPLCRHLAAALDSVPAHKFFVFGGQTAPDGERTKWKYSDEVGVLDCSSMLWMHAPVVGEKPSAREDSAWAYDAKTARLVMLGGWADGWLNDLFTLDVAGVVGPPYSLQTVEPKQGPITGSTPVNIRGLNFEGCSSIQVKFTDGENEEIVEGTLLSDTEIQCRSPVWELYGAGEVDVRVALDDQNFTVNKVRWGFYANTSPHKSLAYGPGLAPTCAWGLPALFRLQAKDSTGKTRTSGNDPFIIHVLCEQFKVFDGSGESPTTETVPVDVLDNEDGTYTCSFIPSMPNAKYTVSIALDDAVAEAVVPIRGSPWEVVVEDPWLRIPKVLSVTKAPAVGSGVSVAVQGNRAVAWGGRSDRVHVLDMIALRWDLPEVLGTAPNLRQDHCLVPVDAELSLLVGGMEVQSTTASGDVSPPGLECEEVWALSGGRTGWRWTKLNCTMAARNRPASCVLPGNGRRVLVSGGEGRMEPGEGVELELKEDGFLLPTANLPKTEAIYVPSLNEEQRLPAIPDALLDYVSGDDEIFNSQTQERWGRRGHALAAVDRETMVALGGEPLSSEVTVGALIMEDSKIEWRMQAVTGKVPAPRTGFAVHVRKEKVYIYGGVDEDNRRLDELFMLNTQTWEWQCLYASNGHWVNEGPAMPLFMMDDRRVVVSSGTSGQMESLHVLEYTDLLESTSIEGRMNLQLVEDLTKVQQFVQGVYDTLSTDPLSTKYSGDEDAQSSLVWRIVEVLYQVKTRAEEIELTIDILKEGLVLLEGSGMNVEMLGQNLERVFDTWKDVKKLAPEMKERIQELQATEAQKLRDRIESFTVKVRTFSAAFKGQKFFTMAHGVDASFIDISRTFSDVMGMSSVAKELDEHATIFEFGEMLADAKDQIIALTSSMREMRELWAFVEMTELTIYGIGQTLWEKVDIELLETTIRDLREHCTEFFAEYVDSDVLIGQRTMVQNLTVSISLITKLKSPNLRNRHWKLLANTVKVKEILHDDPEFLLKDLTSLQLHSVEDDVLEILIAAERESQMESKLETIDDAWSTIEFIFQSHKGTDTYLASLSQEDDETLELHQLEVQQMMSSRYLQSVLRTDRGKAVTFAKVVHFWLQRLSVIAEVVQMVGECQRIWAYLEALYLGSNEVQTELPVGTENFRVIHSELQDVLSAMMHTKVVSTSCSEGQVNETLHGLRDRLEHCEKGLRFFLEKKRVAFPRFFFVGTADLLDMISNASTPDKVVAHFPKIVNAVGELDLEAGSGPDIPTAATGWAASVGIEHVQLAQPLPLEGKVEEYIPQIVTAIGSTLQHLLRASLQEQASMPDTKSWIMRNPNQIVRLTRQILFTSQVEAAFALQSAERNTSVKNLDRLQSEFKSNLGFLIGMVRAELGHQDRLKVVCQIITEAHATDLLQTLISEQVTERSEFKWRQQIKFHWDQENEGPTMSVFDTAATYSFEYAGNGTRLVITPLTDRIFITAMQALHSNLGCSPSGPSGTGKTETVKELATMLGKCLYFFNCSTELDYRCLGDIFKGLGSSGSWGCFDHFNCLLPGVLSVCSTQCSNLLASMSRNDTKFSVMDNELVLKKGCGLFFTMNPLLPGQSELPQSLRVLFRPVTVVAPDTHVICENFLMAHGFGQARTLSHKLAGLCNLSMELLSDASKSDWDLRLIKSILQRAVARKILNKDSNEQELLQRVIVEMTTPKLYGRNLDIFSAAVQDFFPNSSTAAPSDQLFEANFKDAAASQRLVLTPTFETSGLQIHNMMQVRHSVIIMGESGTGKSALWKTLAQTDAAGRTRVVLRDINPKAVSTKELYGYVDLETGEWKDGVFSLQLREFSKANDFHEKWIVLDGDLDANWIESIHSLMDENRVLNLASNERIYMKRNMRLLFEVRDLKYASPSTVSRAGVVFVPQGQQWESLVSSWILAREDSTNRTEIMRVLIDHYVPVILHFIHKELQTAIPVLDFNLVQSLLKLLETLITVDNIPKNSTDEKAQLEAHFVFACIWTFGSCFSTRDGTDHRRLFSNWWKASWTSVRMPQKGSVFEHGIVNSKFVPWSEMHSVTNVSRSTSMDDLTVMTNEMFAIRHVLELLIPKRVPAMAVGPAGVGKTALMRSILSSQPVSSCFCQFSYYSNAEGLQDMLEAPLEKKAGKNYGPIGSKRLVYFIDDLNLPRIDEYGTQSTTALLRQHLDYGHWYDRSKLLLKEINDVQYLACMNPARGSFAVNPRLQRHFFLLAMEFPGPQALATILATFLREHVTLFASSSFEESYMNKVIQATLQLHSKVRLAFRKTAECFQYEFNLRQLVGMFKGILLLDTNETVDETMFTSLWAHEAERSYSDALVSRSDVTAFQKILKEVCKRFFKDLEQNAVLIEPLIFCDMWKTLGEPAYYRADDIEKLFANIERSLVGYNETHPAMNLVLFEDAVRHIARITRILRLGHGLLVGVGGCGKQSATRLAAYMEHFAVFQVNVSSEYTTTKFKDDMRELLIETGVREEKTVLLLSDTHIIDDQFLVLLNELLSSGYIAELFPYEQRHQVLSELRPAAEKAEVPDDNDAMFNFFVSRVRKQLRVIMAFSPVGDTLSHRAVRCPALINCTTMDWFHDWSEKALYSVATRFLADAPLPDGQRNAMALFFPYSFAAVNKTSEEYLVKERRFNHTTPKSFLEFISLYISLLASHGKKIEDRKSRLKRGMEKLVQSSQGVTELEQELQQKSIEVDEKRLHTENLMDQMTTDKLRIQEAKSVAELEAAKCEELSIAIAAQQADCEAELELSLPCVKAAEAALDTISRKDLVELKSLPKPPQGVEDVTAAILALRGEGSRDWNTAKIAMKEIGKFTDELRGLKLEIDEGRVVSSRVDSARQYLELQHFAPENMRKKSRAAAALAEFALNMVQYYDMVLAVEPKRDKLRKIESQYDATQDRMHESKDAGTELQHRLTELQTEYQAVEAEKEVVSEEAKKLQRRLVLAQRLMAALNSEHERWQGSMENLEAHEPLLAGDLLLSASFVAYMGGFTKKYRDSLVADLANFMARSGILCSPVADPLRLLADPSLRERWKEEGLPSDQGSVENAAIMLTSQRYPLLIDPQHQGTNWLRARESHDRNLLIEPPDSKNLQTGLVQAIEHGWSLIVDNLGESMDAALLHIVGRQHLKNHGTMYVFVGEKEVEYNPDFRLFLVTKLTNPHFSPEIQAECTLINFCVTTPGLEEQLLSIIVQQERAEFEDERILLIHQQADFKQRLVDLEDIMLEKLAVAEGNITEDVGLIESLEETKAASMELEDKVETAAESEARINKVREQFRHVAARGTLLHSVLSQLHQVHAFYHYSMESFTLAFMRAIDLDSQKAPENGQIHVPNYVAQAASNPYRRFRLSATLVKAGIRGALKGGNVVAEFELDDDRTEKLFDAVTWNLFDFCRQGLYKRHHLLLSVLLAFSSGLDSTEDTQRELRHLFAVKGPTEATSVPISLTSAVTEVVWAAMLSLQDLPVFSQLCRDYETNSDLWQIWRNDTRPETIDAPGRYATLSEVQRMLLILAMRPDRIAECMKAFVRRHLGDKFVQDSEPSLFEVYRQSRPAIPVLLYICPGVDVRQDLRPLLEKKGYSEEAGTFATLSMGQSQEVVAEKIMGDMAQSGGWVFLQNAHLSLPWLQSLDAQIEGFRHAHPDFRLFLSIETPEDDLATSVPTSILSRCVKVANEPPVTLQSSLQRAWEHIDPASFEQSAKRFELGGLTFGLCILHSLLNSRRRFGHRGWSYPYSFTSSDLHLSVSTVARLLETDGVLPLDELKYLIGDVVYGGRISDPWDQRVCMTYVEALISAESLQAEYPIPGLRLSADSANPDVFAECIAEMPPEAPEAYGMHPNAEVMHLRLEADLLIEALGRVFSGGEDASTIRHNATPVTDTLLELLEQLPADFSLGHALRAESSALGPYEMVLLQECERMNLLLGEMRTSLGELKAGVDGGLNVSDGMESLLDCIRRDVVPSSWRAVAYNSLKGLGAWFIDLLERIRQLSHWNEAMPHSVWIGGLFAPAAFIAALKQVTAREMRWTLEHMATRTHVTGMQWGDPVGQPDAGVYVHGICIEGAAWDIANECLRDQRGKEPNPRLPVVLLTAVTVAVNASTLAEPDVAADSGAEPMLECPAFHTARRGSSFVFAAQLRIASLASASRWIKLGVALVLAS